MKKELELQRKAAEKEKELQKIVAKKEKLSEKLKRIEGDKR